MKNTNLYTSNAECQRSVDAVAYIYGEMNSVSAESFETHLAVCNSCTEELAAVSFSRFSVYEWNRDVFAKLETPIISIPCETAAVTIPSEERTSIFGYLGSLFLQPSFAGGFAVLLLCIGLITVYSYRNFVPTEQNIAGLQVNVENNAVPSFKEPIVNTPVQPIAADTETSVKPSHLTTRSSATARPQKAAIRSVKTKTNVRSSSAPVAMTLADYQDTNDESLRLSQLLDELGG